MRTRTVRIYERDIDRIRDLSGLGPAGSFATAAQLVVDQASRLAPAAPDQVREIVREELDRRRA